MLSGSDRGKNVVCAPATSTLVGQSAACALRLADPEVSRRHARIDIDATHDEWRVHDLGSTNGTWVNDVRIVEAHLEPGARLRLGATVLEVRARAQDDESGSADLTAFGRLLGTSAEMRALYPLFDRLAASRTSVVIEGERGTGKELLAECLHERSPWQKGPFVAIGFANIGAPAVEEELFGRGDRAGALELAHGGTLVLDEISDADPAVQGRLRRALERREASRLGVHVPYPCDARVVATSRRDLDREVQTGRLDEALLQILSVAHVELPPLRRRRDDIDLLADHFARELGAVGAPADALERWREETWPGNVRELRRAVLRRLVVGEDADAGTAPAASSSTDLTGFVRDAIARDRTFAETREELLRAFEQRFVEEALARHGGSVIRAASASGLARRYFQILNARRRTPGE